MKLNDRSRAVRRQLIDDLFNGLPPYSPEEVAQNQIKVNTSNLQATRIYSDAANQCKNALLSTNEYFSVKADTGPRHRRNEYSEKITTNLRKAMKEGFSALRYVEKQKNVSSSTVTHGAGPTVWGDPERWCGSMKGMEDVLLPTRTLLSMENLEHFAIYRRYTPGELAKLVSGPNVDPGWQKDVVHRAIEWAAKQGTGNDANDYVTGFSPERLAENIKENGGIWATDQVATIGAYDFYFTDYDDDDYGWKRRMVLDCPDVSALSLSTGAEKTYGAAFKNILGERGKYLYNSGERTYASKLSEILHFQFGDGSVVAPHRYHSIRGLGFLLYSVCEIQNRLYCSFTEAAFEACMQYFRGSGNDDLERILKVNLTNRAIMPDSVSFMTPDQRWRVDRDLLVSAVNMNKETIADSSVGYNRTFGNESQGPEKTATQISAEVNASSALVGSMLQDLYRYAKYEYREIARRFCIKNSRDVDVRKFRAGCIREGVPEEVLNVDAWEIIVEQVAGNGNRQIAIAQAQMMMAVIDRLDPDAQRVVLRDYAFAVTGDASKVNQLVPLKQSQTTDSSHDAELSASRMLMALSMGLRQGVNHAEYAAYLLASMGQVIQQAQQRGMATPEELAGLITCAGITLDGQAIPGPNGPGNGVADHIAILAQNKESGPEVKQLSDALGNAMNQIKALGQQLQQSQQAQHPQNGNGEVTPETQSKIAADLMKSEASIKIKQQAHDQKLQQRAQSHAQKLAEQEARAQLENATTLRRTQVEEAAKDIETSAAIERKQPETALPA